LPKEQSVLRLTLLGLLATAFLLAACAVPSGPLLLLRHAETTPQPTPDPTTQAIIAAVQGSSQPATTTYASPDGVWRVALAVFACTPMDTGDVYAYETVSLARTDAAAIVDSQLINCGGLGAYGFDSLFWSADSRYFYYTMAREGVPDGCGNWQPPIRRVDVATGASEDVSVGDPSPDAAALTAWLEQHQVHCTPAP
jgi:hypothetical protein